jgi:mono/diheme cytochrome c family protein
MCIVNSHAPQSRRAGTPTAPKRSGPWPLAVLLASLLGSSAPGWRASVADDSAYEAAVAKWQTDFELKVLPILESKCLDCHQGEESSGEFDLSPAISGTAAIDFALLWDRVATRVRLNEMPPPGSPGLSDPEKGTLHRWFDSRPGRDLCSQLATDETKSWYRGHVMSRRVTRSEYNNMVAELFGVDLRPADQFPADGSGGEGFDTVGDSLFTSPIHLESYLRGADEVVETVLTDLPPVANSDTSAGWHRWLGPSTDFADRQTLSDVISRFATEAWRRPITTEELERLLELAQQARLNEPTSPLAGVRQAFKAVLVSPHFLFIVETPPGPDGVQPLTHHQVAARLALFLWSSLPDAPLRELAAQGRLHDPAVLREQVRRMLRDPRSRGLAESFGLQWLELRNFDTRVSLDANQFPEFDRELAKLLQEEAVQVVQRVFSEDRSLLELIDSPETPMTKRLASHYQVPWPSQADERDWQMIELESRRLGGVVTLGAVMASTSYPLRTSPVLRGQWVLQQVLGGRVPPPPEGVPALEESDEHAMEPRTLRQRLEQHRADASCATCHDRIDPLGFGLENYDPLGRWRSEDAGLPVDASGQLPSGEQFDGPEQLKSILINRRDEFLKHLSRKLMGYALGRDLNEFDQCILDKTQERLAAEDYRASLLVEEIVTSYPFLHRYYKLTGQEQP